ncbi:MAG TPA: cupin domain-containing protein [Noviherbaspirillum sp.]|nr:cupin domain-containing protein [Noviherbaspirillum sp.]
MDPRFDKIHDEPWNKIFQVVFFPDRIYHAEYLNATRCDRYRYVVDEVRAKLDLTVLKGQVFMDDRPFTNFLRIEYRSGRLVEAARQKSPPRLAGMGMYAWVKLMPEGQAEAEATVRLDICRWTDSYEVEIWQELDPPAGAFHDFSVLDMMGRDQPITRVAAFSPLLADLKSIKLIELAFREDHRDPVTGRVRPDDTIAWDNNFASSHEDPDKQPSTVPDKNYLINFQRGWYLDAADFKPVRYQNAMMEPDNPDFQANQPNVTEMRWMLQRVFGSTLVFFHEVTVPPGSVEGTHQHIGSEELYYVVSGSGVAYLGLDDDPSLKNFPVVQRHIFGIGMKDCREVAVSPGKVIFTKSGGIHGIRNTGTSEPLKFVAFLYHTA